MYYETLQGIDEKLPYIYTKTLGFSQMDLPVFEKYRLTKEDADAPKEEVVFVTKTEFDELRDTVTQLRKELCGE